MSSLGYQFLPVEQWKSALIALPDMVFFDLMRSVLGAIRSPYNKQRLMEELGSFLSKSDTQKKIAAFIDENDHKIIAAIAILRDPTEDEVIQFFSGELNYAQVKSILLNLEERLIIYRVHRLSPKTDADQTQRHDGHLYLSLNPLLDKALLPFIARYPREDDGNEPRPHDADANEQSPRDADMVDGKSILFPYTKDENAESGAFDAQKAFDANLATFFAALIGENDFFKNDGALRRVIVSKLEKLQAAGISFPVFSVEDAELWLHSFFHLGLLKPDAGINDLCDTLENFSLLTETERLAYIAGGIYVCLEQNNAESMGIKSRIACATGIICSLIGYIDTKAVYPAITLKRFLKIILSEINPQTANPFKIELILTAIEKSGLVKKREDEFRLCFAAKPARLSLQDYLAPREKPVIAFNSAYSFVLLPEISFRDAVRIIRFCELTEEGFVITRASINRALNAGLKTNGMAATLSELSGGRLDDTIQGMLAEWEKRYHDISVYEGVTVVLSADMLYLSQTESFKRLVISNPAPGVFIIKTGDRSSIINVLRKSGIDIIAEPMLATRGQTISSIKNQFSSPRTVPKREFGSRSSSNQSNEGPDTTRIMQTRQQATQQAEEYKEHFRAKLQGMTLTNDEREALNDRIERGLIICETQLENATLCHERLKASSMDYAGKIAIAKQALSGGEILEISFQNEAGKTMSSIGYPAGLEKSDKDTILSLRLLETNDAIRVSVGKIQGIRRIKQSIFK